MAEMISSLHGEQHETYDLSPQVSLSELCQAGAATNWIIAIQMSNNASTSSADLPCLPRGVSLPHNLRITGLKTEGVTKVTGKPIVRMRRCDK
jgi:hypothetical protein